MPSNSPFRTSSDLVLQVLKDTGILSVGQPVDPDDFSNVNDNLDSIFRKIAALEIAYVSDRDNIPGAWFKDLASIVAGECASALGIVGQEYVTTVNNGLGGQGGVPIGAGAAAQSLKIITRGRPTYEIFRMQCF